METTEIKPYIITYTNSFEFEGRLLAFRKRELFDVTSLPKHIPFHGHWNINRKQLSVSKAKELCKPMPVNKDITCLQWYQQEQLNGVFNL